MPWSLLLLRTLLPSFCISSKSWFKWHAWPLKAVSTLAHSDIEITEFIWTLELCWTTMIHVSTGILCSQGNTSIKCKWGNKTCMLHVFTVPMCMLHWQPSFTKHKIKIKLRIFSWWQQNLKASSGHFWAQVLCKCIGCPPRKPALAQST